VALLAPWQCSANRQDIRQHGLSNSFQLLPYTGRSLSGSLAMSSQNKFPAEISSDVGVSAISARLLEDEHSSSHCISSCITALDKGIGNNSRLLQKIVQPFDVDDIENSQPIPLGSNSDKFHKTALFGPVLRAQLRRGIHDLVSSCFGNENLHLYEV